VVEADGFQRSSTDHSSFVRKTEKDVVVLLVYVDYLIVTGDDAGLIGQSICDKGLGSATILSRDRSCL
jgi:hypothetical protein